MPEGTYTMLKPTNGIPHFQSNNTGAHYYAYGASGSVNKYKKISGTIILPTSIKLKGTGNGRNAFISLGVTATNHRGIDIGLRNRGLNGGGDNGYGWHPYCVELDKDYGYYYDGQENSDFPVLTNHKAPSSAKRAKFEVEPNLNGRSVRFSVTWLDGSNNPVGKTFDEVIQLKDTYTWDNFLRFASLVPWPATTENKDSTYVLNGEFSELKIGNANWGISTSQVKTAWIMHEPKCKLVDGYWDTGEKFKIDHWA